MQENILITLIKNAYNRLVKGGAQDKTERDLGWEKAQEK